jgi:transposase
MYSIAIIKSSINLYFKLKKDNIIGKKRIKYIEQTFNIHINTLYKWIDKYYNFETDSFNFSQFKTSFKYNNTKITNDIETFIINSIDPNNNFNIKKIKKNIYTKFNIELSKTTIYYVLHKHNFTYKKLIVKNIPYDDNKIINLKNDLQNKINIIDVNKLFSYDEMSIYLNDKPYKGWSIKGKECFIKTKNKSIFNKRYSVGMSIIVSSV